MTDTAFMRRALSLAASTEGRVSPRPPVGAVVVARDGRVVGEGACTPTPGPHAEVAALERAGDDARGATVYVSLEPCCHVGATGPCSEALVRAGVARVVAAVRDPNPLVSGRGLAALRRSGIEVRTGVLRREARGLIEPFETWVRTGRPFVTLKVAATLDGKVAAPDGSSRWITGEAARRDVHALRARVDGVLVGAGTVAADDPRLTCRLGGYDGPQPRRIILDSSGRTSPHARALDGSAPAVVVTVGAVSASVRDAWRARGADVVVVPPGDGGVSLPAALHALGERGLCHVLAEPGPRLAASLVHHRLADRLVLYQAPKLLGGDAPGLLAHGAKTLMDAWPLTVERVSRIGDDVRVDARLRGGS